MERITIRPDIGLGEIWFANSDDPEGAYTIHDIAEYRCDVLGAIAERLAAYEDTGLTPDEVAALRRERDALLTDLRGDCASCVHRDAGAKSDVCQTCPRPGGAGFGTMWTHCGIQPATARLRGNICKVRMYRQAKWLRCLRSVSMTRQWSRQTGAQISAGNGLRYVTITGTTMSANVLDAAVNRLGRLAGARITSAPIAGRTCAACRRTSHDGGGEA